MLAPYRLAYLSVTSVLIGGLAIVAAETEPKPADNPGAAASAVAPNADDAANSSSYGREEGNLSEVGARELLTMSDYQRAVNISKGKPVLIFKHSTECEVSGAAYRRVAAWIKEKGKDAPALFLVKVIERRPVSQEIAVRSQVKHESPQAILFVDAKPVWNTSHEAITGDAIDAALHETASQPKETD